MTSQTMKRIIERATSIKQEIESQCPACRACDCVMGDGSCCDCLEIQRKDGRYKDLRVE